MPRALEDLAKCAAREVAYRRRVYPRLIARRQMSQAKADDEIAMMEEIAALLAERAKGERLV
jgi:hypothetical protein